MNSNHFVDDTLDSILILPSKIKVVEQEAFRAVKSKAVVFPQGCHTIEKDAFMNCNNLEYVSHC